MAPLSPALADWLIAFRDGGEPQTVRNASLNHDCGDVSLIVPAGDDPVILKDGERRVVFYAPASAVQYVQRLPGRG